MFFKLGTFAYKARWAILIFWVLVIGLAGIFAPKASQVLKSGGFSLPGAESIQVGEEIAQRFNGARSYIFAVYTAPDGTRTDDPVYAQKVESSVAALRQDKEIKIVATYASTGSKDFISSNGKYTYALIGLNLDYDKAQARVADLDSTIKKSKLDVKLTGLPVVYEAFNTVSQHDVEQAEMLTFPLALIILLLVFRTLIAAAMPLMIAVVSVGVTLMSIYFIGQSTDLSIFVLNISTMLGLGMGIDYALFIVSRFREELYKQNGNVQGAIRKTMGTSGKAIFFSGLTVMVGLGSLLLSQFTMLRSIGIGGMLVVGLSVIAALTLLPAVLSLLGRRINAWKVPGLKPVDERLAQQHATYGFWHNLAQGVSRRPVLVMIPVLALLLLMGSPFLHIRYGEPTYQALPASEPSRQGAEILDQYFPSYGKNSDVFLLVKAKNGNMTDPANSGLLYDYATSLKSKYPQINTVVAGGQDLLAMPKEQFQQLLTAYGANPASLNPQMQVFLSQLVSGDTASLKLLTGIEYSSQSANDFIKDLRNNQPASLNVRVGGEQAGLLDFVSVLYADFPTAILVVIVISYVLLFIMFQSAVLPIKAVITTGLSLSASYGALVWIFQDGNLSSIMGSQNLGYVEATLPILLFAVLFGLSMDYEVFMLSRIKEYYDETGNNSKSVAMGLERTGGMITSAALVMVVVAGAFGTADVIIIKAVGIGMALAVALDATIVRAVLVPATMKILGKANWWAPGFIRRFLPKVSVE
ncbi:MAG TPA: MMPL family transporter [Chloroflexia bacterium]|nr:MMPL family transporter [Chloroflexia bacterium]